MFACPCCGYKTLSERGGYDLCPVCWWEDEGLEPWEYSGPNARTLVDAQQAYLAERRPHRRRPGKVRAPKKQEARDPSWRPHELTDELLARVEQANAEFQREWEEEQRLAAQEVVDDPEGPFKDFNAAMRLLRSEAPTLPHRDVKARMRDLSRAHGMRFPNAHLEMFSRLMEDDEYYRRHPGRIAWWMLRYSRPSTFKQRWTEIRSGSISFAG